MEKVRRLYHDKAKMYHPDKTGDDGEKFVALFNHYTVLKTYLEKRKNDPKYTEKVEKRILAITWQVSDGSLLKRKK